MPLIDGFRKPYNRVGLRLCSAILVFVAGCSGNESIGPAVSELPTTSTTVAISTTAVSTSTAATVSTSTSEVQIEGTIGDLAVTEVVFDNHMTVTNTGEGSVSTDGVWLCNRPFYTPMPAVVLGPGESIELDIGDLGNMPALGGEAALYSSNDFEDPNSMLDYVTWGRGGGRIRAAVEAGLWPEGDVVAEPSGSSIVAPLGGSSSQDWASP